MIQPPLGEETSARVCQWQADFSRPDLCGAPATWHIMWNSALQNSLSCDKHADLVRATWVYYAVHRVEPPCLTDQPFYDELLDRCIEQDPDGRPLEAVAAYA